MSRKAVARRRAQVIVHTRAELEAERDRRRVATADCRDSDCVCHRDEWTQLREVLFLLDEETA